MTRLVTEGFEMGDDDAFTGGGSFSVVSDGYVRSGNYAARSPGDGYFSVSSLSEVYIRFSVLIRNDNQPFYVYLEDTLNDDDLVRITITEQSNMTAHIDGSLVDTGSYVFYKNINYLIEVYANIDDSSGRIITKVNGVEDINYSGDTDPTSSSVIDYVNFTNPAVQYKYIDDIAINDTNGSEDNSWCGDGRIIAIKPNGNGDQSDLTGSDSDSTDNYLLVDDIPSDGDSTYVWSDTATDFDLYNLTAPSLPVNHRITRIYAEARAKDPDTGDIKLIIKPDSTVYKDSAATTLTTSYSAIKGDEYTENPDDGNAWEESDLDDLQAGVEIQ